MTILTFPAVEVRKLLDHAKAATGHKLTIGERLQVYGEPKGWDVQPDEEKHGKPGLWLVKDEGIYLMSNGTPALLTKAGSPNGRNEIEVNAVVYAEGYDPTKQDRGEVWDAARAAVGGDDFVEMLPVGMIEAGLPAGAETLTLRVTADSIQVLEEKRRQR